VPELKIECDCRKPRTGLIDRAVRELAIDRRSSWIVGDTSSDIEAGRRAGLRTVLVRTGHAGLDGKQDVSPDYVVPDLAAAVDWILRGHGAIARQLFAVCAAASASRLVLVGGPARAGKTSAAHVLAELMAAAGRTSHVISLDGWLLPGKARAEGHGVLDRYDMPAAEALLQPLLLASDRREIRVPEHDRKNRTLRAGAPRSIGPDDLLIVEGVTALMDNALLAQADVRVFVDVPEDIRRERLQAEYAWRGDDPATIERRLASREQDELPAVRASAARATHHIQSSQTP
jgi:uridine kinase